MRKKEKSISLWEEKHNYDHDNLFISTAFHLEQGFENPLDPMYAPKKDGYAIEKRTGLKAFMRRKSVRSLMRLEGKKKRKFHTFILVHGQSRSLRWRNSVLGILINFFNGTFHKYSPLFFFRTSPTFPAIQAKIDNRDNDDSTE